MTAWQNEWCAHASAMPATCATGYKFVPWARSSVLWARKLGNSSPPRSLSALRGNEVSVHTHVLDISKQNEV